MSAMEPQHRPTQGRARAKSGFSFTSHHSKESDGKKQEPLRESHDEKRKLHLSNTTKANPNAAMTELQPVAAALEASTMGSLRGRTFCDVYGNPITDPDLSNPTRRRTERPLETIRAFEAAIDGEYNQTSAGPGDYDYSSRRSSAYWGQTQDQTGMNGSRVSNNAGPYYNQRGRDSNAYDNSSHNSRNRFGARQQSDPALNRYNNPQGVYPTPGYGQSRDTVNTGGSNGSASDQWQQSTDPSSENSSIDRVKGDAHEQQAHREPISEEGNYTYGNGGQHPGHMGPPGANGAFPPAPPPKNGSAVPRREIIKLGEPATGSHMPLGASSGNVRPSTATEPKRGSWLKRRFSKKE